MYRLLSLGACTIHHSSQLALLYGMWRRLASTASQPVLRRFPEGIQLYVTRIFKVLQEDLISGWASHCSVFPYNPSAHSPIFLGL